MGAPLVAATLALAPLLVGGRILAAIGFPQGEFVRVLDAASGLPSARVVSVHQDSRGYVWIATWEGLARFDGEDVRVYGEAEGLPDSMVNVVAEGPDGVRWVGAQRGGIARYEPQRTARGGAKAFESFRVADAPGADEVNAILFDEKARLWLGTAHGIYRERAREGRRPLFEPVVTGEAVAWPALACRSRDGTLWFGLPSGVVEASPAGVRRHDVPGDPDSGPISALAACEGGLLVARERRIDRLAREKGVDRWESVPIPNDPIRRIRALAAASDGRIWAGGAAGLWVRERGEWRSLFSGAAETDRIVRHLEALPDGGLWVGTWSGGAVKVESGPLRNYGVADGLPDPLATRILEGRDGAIYVATDAGFVEVRDRGAAPVPSAVRPADFRGLEVCIAQDSSGDWWVGGAGGLVRRRGPRLALDGGEPVGAGTGLPESLHCARVVATREGRIVVATREGDYFASDPGPGASPRFQRIPAGDRAHLGEPREIVEDRAGTLWAVHWIHLGRIVLGDSPRIVPYDAFDVRDPRSVHLDARGVLWVGTRYEGLWRIEDPLGPSPRVRRASPAEGNPIRAVFSIAEGAEGVLWLGTTHGLVRYDPSRERWSIHGMQEGLAGDIVNHVHVDRRGRIWVATANGASLVEADALGKDPAPQEVLLTRALADAEDLPVPDGGTRNFDAGVLASAPRQLTLDCAAPGSRIRRPVRYQFKLGDAPWSPPLHEHTLRFAGLAPGAYQLSIRAMPSGGAGDPEPASFRFSVPPPFWRTPWFVAAASVSTVAFFLAWHLLRVRRLVAIERVRRQIATDVHDDLGAGLSRIAILAEVAKRDANAAARVRLDDMADLARAMRDALREIVWAIDPRRDRASDLAARMREFASQLLEAEDRSLDFHADPGGSLSLVHLTPEQKRHGFLFFKEAVHNAARHSGATRVTISLRSEPGALVLAIEDDGSGFDPAERTEGLGLSSLRDRAAAVRGTIEIETAPGRGTRVVLRIPVHRGSRILMRDRARERKGTVVPRS